MAVFADRAIEKLRARGSPLCIGLDPYPDQIPALFGDAREDVGALEKFFREILPIAAKHAVAVKPQMGFFEPYGEAGYGLARALSAEAQSLGLISILDAKRGDIGSTAEGYARAAFNAAPGFDADVLTVNPYLGRDSLEPFLAAAEKRGRAVAVLVRTSNPGARDLQDLPVNGAPLWERVAAMIAPDSARLKGGNRLVWSDGRLRRHLSRRSAPAAVAFAGGLVPRARLWRARGRRERCRRRLRSGPQRARRRLRLIVPRGALSSGRRRSENHRRLARSDR